MRKRNGKTEGCAIVTWTRGEKSMKFDGKRFFWMVMGNVILAFGIAMFRLSMTGSDAFTSMNIAVSDTFGWKLGDWQLALNLILLVVEFAFGRHYIGWGTLLNGGLLGYMVSFFWTLLGNVFGVPDPFIGKIILMVAATFVVSFGVAMYQAGDQGVAPYDYLAIGMHERLHLPYAPSRIFTDGVCVLVTFALHGLIGVGTVVCTFLLGPLVSFFTTHVMNKLINGKDYEGK